MIKVNIPLLSGEAREGCIGALGINLYKFSRNQCHNIDLNPVVVLCINSDNLKRQILFFWGNTDKPYITTF